MADKKPKKPVVLPAVGKPKKKPAKSSIREIGARAAKDYERAEKTKVGPLRRSHGWNKEVEDATEREWARQVAEAWEQDLKRQSKGSKSALGGRPAATERQQQRLARSTGMYKGGLVTKKGKRNNG